MEKTEKQKKSAQIWYLKNKEREREKRKKYYDENVKGTKRKYNPEAAKRARDKFRASHKATERYCKCCKKNKAVELFEPRKHYCIKCAPKKGSDSDKRYRKNLKIKEVKAIKLAEKELKRTNKLTQTNANQRKPIRIPKEKPIVTREDCIIKMTDTRVYPKVRDVRRGWDDTMAKLRAKFQTV